MKKEKQSQSFNIRASPIRNRAGYLLHLVFLHLYLSSYLIPLILTVLEMLILLRQNQVY